MLSYRIAPLSTLSTLKIIDKPSQLTGILQAIEKQGYMFLDITSDFTTSYKGFISFIMLGFNQQGYLIDALPLRKEIKQLKSIIENPKITKFCYRLNSVLEEVKREWKCFGSNFFDF